MLREGLDPNNIRRNTVIQLKPRYLPTKDLLGINYFVNVNDHIGWKIFVDGLFDCAPIGVAEFLRSQCPSGVFIDVGANIGSTSIAVAKLGIPAVGIEASPSIVRDLANNVGLNSPIPYSIINVAVSSASHCQAESFAKIFSPNGNSGASSLYENWSPSKSTPKIELSRLTTLDAIVEWLHLENILAVKLDVEGAECSALDGFQKTIARLKPFVIFEWRPGPLKKVGLAQDIRALFPSNYHFYCVNAKLIDHSIALSFTNFEIDHPAHTALASPVAVEAKEPIVVKLTFGK
jgi:FkbM family methyltransferase